MEGRMEGRMEEIAKMRIEEFTKGQYVYPTTFDDSEKYKSDDSE